MKVGIAGIGGIGSNVARHLAQAKVRKIKIVDFDSVEETNLNRQFYTVSQIGKKKTESLALNLQEIYPAISVEQVEKKIASEDIATLFTDCEVVVEGFDDKLLKTMLINGLAATDKRVVSASGIAGTDMTDVRVKRVGNCYIVGDFISDEKDFPLFPPKIALVAAIMAGIVLQGGEDE
jgi:sulfur carrier protein ThiS adenylyltransferase